MCRILADFKRFPGAGAKVFRPPQGLVNHVSQALVNHDGEWLAGDA
jgi:hypothetical protein